MEIKTIPLSVPNFSGKELEYVTNAVQSEWVSTAGNYIELFEQAITEYVHSEGAVACQSGTAGLHTALITAGVNQGDIVIVPTLTFIAAVNPVSYIGAEPIFMDCDDSFCMDMEKLEDFFLTSCEEKKGKLYDKKTKKRIKAVIVVHVFGNMADMEHLQKLAKRYDLIIIEDATEALGTYYTTGKYKGCFAGTIGDIGVYSFNGNKIITTGGGGMLVSNQTKYLKHAKHLTTQAKKPTIAYEHDEIGYNYRMTNIQAALGLAQLEQIETFIKVKEKNYTIYQEQLDNIEGLNLAPFQKSIRSNKWFYALICDTIKFTKNELIQYLSQKQIQTRPIWGLINEQKPYRNTRSYKIEKANWYWEKVVNLPCSTSLKQEEIDYIIKSIKMIS